MKLMEKKITAKDMELHLANRYYDRRQWVFLTQVRSSTGSADRVADAMAFNMYGSTGFEIIGFEIKVSRSDFLSELKDMSKSDELMSYCDKWFLVVPDEDIVKEGELPKNWGLLVLQGDKLVQKVRPTVQHTVSMPLHFIASLLRRSNDEIGRIESQYVKREEIEKEITEARRKGYEEGRGYDGKRTEESLKNLRDQVIEFEKATGLSFTEWRGKEYTKTLGVYVKAWLNLTDRSLDYDIRNIENAISTLQRSVIDMKKIKKTL